MFLSTSVHTLDAKGRCFVPKRFQKHLDRDEDGGNLQAVLAQGFGNCIFLFDRPGFNAMAARLQTEAFEDDELLTGQRLFFANSIEVQLDSSGRVLIPAELRAYAGLEDEVVMVGTMSRAELWDKRAWERYLAENNKSFSKVVKMLSRGHKEAAAQASQGGDGGR